MLKYNSEVFFQFYHTVRIYQNAVNEDHNKLVQLRHENRVHVIPQSNRVEPKPLYLCPECSNHMYSNNMIQMQCLIKHSK
jgi:hypothetical protein